MLPFFRLNLWATGNPLIHPFTLKRPILVTHSELISAGQSQKDVQVNKQPLVPLKQPSTENSFPLSGFKRSFVLENDRPDATFWAI